MPKARGELTTREEIFVNALPACDWVEYEAAKKAYRCKNDNVASVIASHLIKKSSVQEAIAKLKADRLKKLGIHHERILKNRVMVAEADVRDFFYDNGTFKPPSEWTKEMAACVAGLEVIEIFEGQGKDRRWTGYLKKLKLNDRNSAQHDLMDHAGLLSERGTKVDLTVNVMNREMSNMELSARVMYLLSVAMDRAAAQERKQIENKGATENDSKR